MIDEERRQERRIEKERVRRRMRVEIDPENYEYIPEKDPVDYYDTSVHQRVAVYVRVSTDDVQQTTSYELQQKYYKDFVEQHPNWELVDIYADATCIIGTNQSPSEWAAICPYFSCFPSIWRRHTR